MPKACAYCGAAGRLTREHLLNGAMHAPGFVAIDTNRGTIQKEMFTIRDVCGACNSRRLSWLDGYAAGLDARYFRKRVELAAKVRFLYDYKRLVGWLMKWAFNTARFNGFPSEGFQTLLPFLLGDAAALPAPVAVYLGLIEPTRPVVNEQTKGPGPRLYPEVYGAGPIRAPSVANELLAGYVLAARAYFFTLVWWPPGTPKSIRTRHIDHLRRNDGVSPDWRGMYQLRPGYGSVDIKRSCMSFESLWEHQAARIRSMPKRT